MAALTPYSLTIVLQYDVPPIASPNASSCATFGSVSVAVVPGHVTVTMTAFLSTGPVLFCMMGISGLNAGYVVLGAPWSTGPLSVAASPTTTPESFAGGGGCMPPPASSPLFPLPGPLLVPPEPPHAMKAIPAETATTRYKVLFRMNTLPRLPLGGGALRKIRART